MAGLALEHGLARWVEAWCGRSGVMLRPSGVPIPVRGGVVRGPVVLEAREGVPGFNIPIPFLYF